MSLSQNTAINKAILEATEDAQFEIGQGKLIKLSDGECAMDESSFYTIAAIHADSDEIEDENAAQDKIVSALSIQFPDFV
jgi:hypothetical protein